MKSRVYQQEDGTKILDLISHREHLEEFKNLSLGTFNEDDIKDKQFINTMLELIDLIMYTVKFGRFRGYQDYIHKIKNFNIRVNHKSFRILWEYFMQFVPVSFNSAVSGTYFLHKDIKIIVDESLKDYEYTLTETLMTNKSE